MEFVALSIQEETFSLTETAKKSHAVSLLKNIDFLLKEKKKKIEDLHLIGVGIGPGSFTGIRIAVSTARMLAQILKIPLIPLSSPLLYASSVEAKEKNKILIAFDAKKQRVFGALYQKEKNNLREMITPGDYKIEQLLEKNNSQEKIFFIGDGVEKYSKEIISSFPNGEFLSNFNPQGTPVCDLILKKYLKNQNEYKNPFKVNPFYARLSEAEINKKAL